MIFPVFQPFIGDEEINACRQALNCKYLGMGSYVLSFEEALSSFLGLASNQYLISCSTGHAALHMALLALGVGEGDEVITPSFNNIADLQAIKAVGAKPVFCDILPDSLCVDPTKLEEQITPNTKAIIIIDYGASLADHSTLNYIAHKLKIPLIHDAAHSFGSKYNDQHIGHQADITMFSFDPIKNITAIDGGALVVRDKNLVQILKDIRFLGMRQNESNMSSNTRDWNYDVFHNGYRYHLANLHASVGLTQLSKFPLIKELRQQHYIEYYNNLASNPCVHLQASPDPSIVPFIMCVRVEEPIRSSLKDHLRASGIETGLHWRPAHTFSLFDSYKADDLPVTNLVSKQIISLPFYPDLKPKDIKFICDEINQFTEKSAAELC